MKTEHEILEMAFDMFLEKGFSEVSTNEIIREAGLTKGGFYYYFKSREDLDQRVVERFIHPFFTNPVEKMQEVWNGKKQDIPTGELLWHGFFMPQRFVNFQKADHLQWYHIQIQLFELKYNHINISLKYIFQYHQQRPKKLPYYLHHCEF